MSAGVAFEIISPAMAIAAKAWIDSFTKKPKTTVFVSVLTIILIIAGVYLLDKKDKEKREVQRLTDFQYETQITQLKETEKNIVALLQFIDYQKQNLRETQDTIEILKEERKLLKPLVESDKAVVEAVFKAQEQRQNANVWKERWAGFAFGFAASLLASFLWYLLRILMKKRGSSG